MVPFTRFLGAVAVMSLVAVGVAQRSAGAMASRDLLVGKALQLVGGEVEDLAAAAEEWAAALTDQPEVVLATTERTPRQISRRMMPLRGYGN